MGNLRSKRQTAKYESYRAAGGLGNGCRLCEKEPIRDFKHWRIAKNDFPFDKIAKVHQMILPKRHVGESGLRAAEIKELAEIKKTLLHKDYEYIIETTHLRKSIPAHFHLHLIITRD